MLFAFRNFLLSVKKIAVLIWGRNHCQGYRALLSKITIVILDKRAR